ncbi:endo alpha-1,4 polygalactosaminidase [Nocardia iowensis]|uniref:Endo alpha-1,4 polygalactosaminidase n=1 Tax=Nocardia iowensis TaxID=204891 RepID=A0ABX8RHC6_NOCIO|nr:endo alpha-1,4 polygalactosaminidase [Nocardia iowensis]QXN88292.1 endo alpha-1,4 polygalactosaminidase [Nocardia iowensis]
MIPTSTARIPRRWTAAMAALIAATGFVVQQADSASAAPLPGVTLPPAHAGFDYQITEPYDPPPGVGIVSRDHTAAPARGMYNICYVNAFQVQPDAQGDWPPDLLLRDANGEVVMDEVWNEALLDIRTQAKRDRIAVKINQWVDGCAGKGFNAVEPDNYDSYTRSQDLLTADHAVTFITALAAHAHARGLAIGQKNAAELADRRVEAQLDFAVAEECGDTEECGIYARAFDDHVVDIEYTDAGLAKACADFKDRMSIVRRDTDVTVPGDPNYVRKTC